MRDHLFLYINGQPCSLTGETAFMPLSDYLRYHRGATGTKVVCAEGDCGACTVLIGTVRNGEMTYRPINACIQYLYQLDATHIITVEGLSPQGTLNPVQEAMVQCHGAQCGYCTPGFVVALSAMQNACMTETKPEKTLTQQDIKDVLTGNLCRCTGYEPILKAGLALNNPEPHAAPPLRELYPQAAIIQDLSARQGEAVRIEWEDRLFYKPTTVSDAVAFKAKNPHLTVVSGGTDVGVFCNKRGLEPPVVMSLSQLSELEAWEMNDTTLSVGARVTLAQLETLVQERIPELYDILVVFGGPQIKYAGTLAGNIANGSPIGDTLPFLYVMNAMVELTGKNGSRTVNINALYTGYRTLDMTPDELITRIHIPLPQPGEVLKLYKVSKRQHLDISTFTAALWMQLEDNRIGEIRLAYGGVGPTVLRLPKAEAFLKGQPWSLETMKAAGKLAVEEITPLSDVRGSARYRFLLAENILQKFYWDVAQPPAEVAV
jgi:xanthine dehydrogenase small subunit